MSVKEMVELLDVAYEARDQIVPCLVGTVGIGKTAAVEKHVENMREKTGKDIQMTTIIASQILPNEVSGITMPDSETKSMEIYDHFKLSHMKDGDILFFDELFEAEQYVLSACLTLIESRMMMSGRKLPDIQIVAATNPTVVPVSIKPSIRQRFMFEKVKFDSLEFNTYTKSRFGVTVPPLLLSRIEQDSDDFNIVTPRSITKMICWMSIAENLGEASVIKKHIGEMWGYDVAEHVYGLYPRMKQHQRELEIKRALANEFDLSDELVNSTLKDMVKALEESGDWEKAAEFLAKQDMVN